METIGSRKTSSKTAGSRKTESKETGGKKKPGKVRTSGAKKKITFKLSAPQAKNVSVAGNFNAWDIFSHPLRQSRQGMEDGTWQKVVYLEPGTYEYRFVVDGRWCDDPLCEEYVCNEFGTSNGVICI